RSCSRSAYTNLGVGSSGCSKISLRSMSSVVIALVAISTALLKSFIKLNTLGRVLTLAGGVSPGQYSLDDCLPTQILPVLSFQPDRWKISFDILIITAAW